LLERLSCWNKEMAMTRNGLWMLFPLLFCPWAAAADKDDQPLSARYPDDVGLRGDPAVLLFDDFESGEISKAKWSFAVPKANIATAPQPVHGGQRSHSTSTTPRSWPT